MMRLPINYYWSLDHAPLMPAALMIDEIKHDGYRMIVRRDGDRVRLYSRKAIDWTARLPAIAESTARLGAKSFTIDGEAVVIGPDGLTDFEALRRRGAGDIAVLYAFDLMELDGNDLRGLPIETRRATLASLLRNPGAVRFSDHILANGPDVFAHACRLGAEGIVSKRLGSPYRSGPCSTWIKVRNPAGIAVQRERSEKLKKGGVPGRPRSFRSAAGRFFQRVLT
jgi:bifunctional non-homologous end joining protein LigD